MALIVPRLRLSYGWQLTSFRGTRRALRTTVSPNRQHYAASFSPSSWSSSISQKNHHTSRLFSTSIDGDDEVLPDAVQVSDDEDDEDDALATLTQGMPSGWFVVQQYEMADEFEIGDQDADKVERLELTPHNVSLPVALMLMDPEEYPSFSRARKVCRKGNILVQRKGSDNDTPFADLKQCFIGRVGDRIYPGDIIGRQVRMGGGSYPIMSYKQPFELPVVYQDDYFAIVNKPAGVVVYAHRQGGHGIMTVRACLPFALTPPDIGVYSVLRRPQPVHRLDKPTSGLLLVAKTKPAMQHLTKQFRDRIVKKTYTAIVNGIPTTIEGDDTTKTSQEAAALGVDVDPNDNDRVWQYIDFDLEERDSITLWRSHETAKCVKAFNGTLTVVELKPKTGRYHQLRRHMAWVCDTPILGDKDYDGGKDAMSLRDEGLFLCSNRVTLQHPYYNTKAGRVIWNSLSEEEKRSDHASVFVSEEDNDTIMVTASIDLPTKFKSFMAAEQEKAENMES